MDASNIEGMAAPGAVSRRGGLVAASAAKRGFDMGVALVALVLAAPLFLLIALAIKLDSRGPVFFRQTRTGRFGRPFRIIKFRTLEVGAGTRQVLREDPRVTRIGRLLRSLSFDELPQLFNVLNGDMAIVGPRPHACAHDVQFAAMVADWEMRFSVRPGMTGLAQVQGFRGAITDPREIRARLAADLAYMRSWSLWLDCKIVLATALRVWRDERAY